MHCCVHVLVLVPTFTVVIVSYVSLLSCAAWWFQKGNEVRTEATVNLDLKTKVQQILGRLMELCNLKECHVIVFKPQT